jgi:D-sedoheptulose 7-phosphate isomerase
MTLLFGNRPSRSGPEGTEPAGGGPDLDPAEDLEAVRDELGQQVDRQLESVWRRSAAEAHLDRLADAIDMLRAESGRIVRWSEHLADVLVRGGRLLVAGNGGSAAEAQHLTAELVGRLRDDRPAYSAIALTAETSSLTAIGNDYGYDRVFARQVQAHGRPGDVLILLSTSGRSPNLLAAAEMARERDVVSWAMTGPLPNPLAMRCDDALILPADPQTVQELHLVAVHVLCGQVEAALPAAHARAARAGAEVRR